MSEIASLPFPPDEPPPSNEKTMHPLDASGQWLRSVGKGRFLHAWLHLYEETGEPLFNGKEACAILGIKTQQRAFARLDDDEKVVRKAHNLWHGQEMVFITESGLYHLIFLSRKPEAKAFRRWVTHEVLPSLRRFGQFPAPKFTPAEPLRLTAKLAALLPTEVAALPLRRQLLIAERIECCRAVELAPHPGLMARCRHVAGLALSRRRNWSAITIYRLHRRYTSSSCDWRSLTPQFEKRGRRKLQEAV